MCWRRLKTDPPCRLKFEPGAEADFEIEVGEYAAIFIARLGLERELALGDGIQRPLPHDSGRPFVIDVRAPSGKLSSDTAVSIAGKLVLDGIDHFGKLVIAEFNVTGR